MTASQEAGKNRSLATGAGASLLRNHIEETALPIEHPFITDVYWIYQEFRNC